MLDWVSRIGIEYMRLKESWMDLLHQPAFESQEWQSFVAEENGLRAAHNDRTAWLLQAQAAMNAQFQDPRIPGDVPEPKQLFDALNRDHYDQWLENRRRKHMDLFPFTDNFVACIYRVLADLNES